MRRIDAVNISSVDLNLLVALDALVRERSVTRAGRRIGLSQPAMSNVLGRLRQLFDDPLLVRTSHGMVPTPRATELIGPLRKGLAELEGVLAMDRTFDSSKAERVFRVAAMDHTWVVLLPRLARLLERRAPGIRLDVFPYGDASLADLESGQIDAAIVVGPKHGRAAGFRRAALYDDHFACLVRRHHPRVKGRLTLKLFLELGHVLASPRGRRGGLVDRALRKKGLSRHVQIIVSQFSAAPFVVAETDLITTVPGGVARPFAMMLDLQVFPPPIPLAGGPWFLLSHERTAHDPAVAWLRDRILEIARGPRGIA